MASRSRTQQPTLEISAPPTNLEAERAVLGYYIVGGTWREDVTAHDFAAETEQVVWHAMRAIHAVGEAIDRQRVAIELGERKLKQVGIGYLADLGDGCYPEMNVEPYVHKLHDATAKRSLLHHAHILMSHIRTDDRTADELIAMVEAFVGLQPGRNHQEPPPTMAQWPEPLREDAYHGISGDLVRTIEPHSEADPAALLLQFLVGFGNMAGRGPYYLAEEDRHHTNLFCVLVGVTSKGRKGTAWGRTRAVLHTIDAHWAESCLVSGVGSGEALIDALNTDDHRRVVLEPEFARLLAIIAREGTTISSIFRQCWDRGAADVTVRAKPAHVTAGHLSLIAHVTRDELLRRLSDVELGNGFANRVLWVCTRRSKELPFGGGSINFGDIPARFHEAFDFARRAGDTRFDFDGDAKRLWLEKYHDLSEGKPGLFGAVTGRAEAQVVRLSLIYALLDRAKSIGVEHLRAALAVWAYCEASARYVWRDDLLGDPVADQILAALRAAANGMTRWDLYNHFSRHVKEAELDRAISVLAERGLIRSASEDTGGRPVTRYWAV